MRSACAPSGGFGGGRRAGSTAFRVLAALAMLVSTALHAQGVVCPFNVSAPETGARASATVDGLLLTRFATPLRDTALTNKVRPSLPLTAAERFITDNISRFDIDGDGSFTRTDAQLITRHLNGYTGEALVRGLSFAGHARRKAGTAVADFIAAGCPAEVETDPVEIKALALWRKVQVKGSCSGCHGADYFDLARIGSSDATIMRRALADGATVDEASALIAAVKNQRTQHNIPATDPLTFRPFQPGGALLPGARPIDRDLALGRSLQTILPITMTPRTDGLPSVHSLAVAKAALTEWLAIDLRTLPVGIEYPRWSADIFNGAAHGTLNDWIADLASEPKDEADRVTWHALQDAYLRDPNDANFWAMFSAVDKYTANFMPLASGAESFTRHKFKSALFGQHMMRNAVLGRTGFTQGPMAFAYAETSPLRGLYNRMQFLPGGNMWEIGEGARAALGQDDLSPATGPLRDRLVALGMPQFVTDSARSDMIWKDAEEEMRVPWFWLGFTFEPSLRRINGSNSTRVGEYMTASLIDTEMFLHHSLSMGKRIAVQGTVAEKMGAAPTYAPHYSYSMAYSRELIRWNDNPRSGPVYGAEIRGEMERLWSQLVANNLRKNAYLYREALQDGSARDAAGAPLQKEFPWCPALRHFAKYQPQFRAHDEPLINDLAREMGVTLTCGVTYPY